MVPALVNRPHFTRSRREICPCEIALVISSRFFGRFPRPSGVFCRRWVTTIFRLVRRFCDPYCLSLLFVLRWNGVALRAGGKLRLPRAGPEPPFHGRANTESDWHRRWPRTVGGASSQAFTFRHCGALLSKQRGPPPKEFQAGGNSLPGHLLQSTALAHPTRENTSHPDR